jgi:hypothetical protein
MMSHKGKSALEILGSSDDLKFSVLSDLFGQAASDTSDRRSFTEALDQFYVASQILVAGPARHDVSASKYFALLACAGVGRVSLLSGFHAREAEPSDAANRIRPELRTWPPPFFLTNSF